MASQPKRSTVVVRTTVGDLVAAAYDAAGSSRRRTERAARLLASEVLRRRLSRAIELVRGGPSGAPQAA